MLESAGMGRDGKIGMGMRQLTCLVIALIWGITFSLTSGFAVTPAWASPEIQGTAVQIAAVEGDDIPEPRKLLETKIDVNNTILRNYRKLPGFYPTLARILILNAPYDSLEEILEIEGLTEEQKQLIRANFVNFELGEYREGDSQRENLINKGYYG